MTGYVRLLRSFATYLTTKVVFALCPPVRKSAEVLLILTDWRESRYFIILMFANISVDFLQFHETLDEPRHLPGDSLGAEPAMVASGRGDAELGRLRFRCCLG